MTLTAGQRDLLAASPDAFTEQWSLTIVLRRDADGPTLLEEPVTDADLAEARSEAWLNGFLRQGQPDLPLEAVTTRVAPLFTEQRCIGFALRASGSRNPDSNRTPSVYTFGVRCLAPVAQRGSTRLLADGQLTENDNYIYELKARPGPTTPQRMPEQAGMKITTRTTPLRFATRPLEPLLATTRTVGEIVDDVLPVIFTEAAHEKSRLFARRGASQTPAVETGSILLGELSACPDSGEMFVTVDDAIEVVDAEQEEFSLIPSSRSWARVQAVLDRLTSTDSAGTRRLVGQSHGHNFGLEGEPCALCATARQCSRTNVFVSAADRTFMRTVFAGQPFALCWIAGTNARAEEVSSLFTLRAGVLQARGYHVVASFSAVDSPLTT
jgi:hypothetical protein